MDIAISGSGSNVASNFKHIMYKSQISKSYFQNCTLDSVIQNISNKYLENCHVTQTGLFARSVLHERDQPQFLNLDQLNDVLHCVCVE